MIKFGGLLMLLGTPLQWFADALENRLLPGGAAQNSSC